MVLSLQMEDGHSLFDYSVGLNDIVQLLVRQSPAVLPAGSKEKDSELSDTDSGCGSGPSESDKSSHNGEGALELEGQPSTAAQPDWTDPGFGLYKVGPHKRRALRTVPCQGNCSSVVGNC